MKRILAAFGGAAILLSAQAFAADFKGRVSESVYFSSDDASSQNYAYNRTKLRLDATDIKGAENSAHFDGAYIGKGTNLYASQAPDMRVDTANLKMEKFFTNADLVLGRQSVDSLVGARVDGALYERRTGDSSGFGLFAGTMPDPYTDAFSAAFLTYGGYGFYKARQKGATLGYATSLYNGKEDQSYVFGSAYFAPTDGFSSNASVRMDNNAAGKSGYDITNLLATVNYRWGWYANLNLSYNQYRALWYQASESMTYGLNMELQKSARVYGDITLKKTVKFYTDFDYRTRDSDGNSASLFILGLRESELFGKFYYNLAYRNMSYFTMLSSQIFAAGGAQINETTSGEISAAYAANSQTGTTNDMTQMIYSASANWAASKSWIFTCLVEMSSQKFVSVDSVYLAKYKDEYRSTSVYANLSYRF